MKWEDIDFQAGALSVRRQLHDGGAVGPPKSERGLRTIALSAEIVTLLRQHHARQAERRLALGPRYQDGGWVFATRYGASYKPTAAVKHFGKVLERAGLPPMRWHDLRHTACSLLVAAGVPIPVVAQRAGHASAAFTMATYAHAVPGGQDAAVQATASLFHEGPPKKNVGQ
ncbi:MAG: site-specific integrase [Candidimonas sp.]|nr:MAG: site-specific integrase [Candidimonas sp.]